MTRVTRHGKDLTQIVPTPPTGEGSSHTRVSDSNTAGTAQQSGESQNEGANTFAGQVVKQIEALVQGCTGIGKRYKRLIFLLRPF